MLNQINSNIENQIDIIYTAYMTAEQFSLMNITEVKF